MKRIALPIVSVLLMAGCAVVDVRITKSDGTTIQASGVSFAKDHGLEGLTYERSHDERGKGLLSPATSVDSAKFGLSGYTSTARIELLLKLLEAAK